MQHTHSDLVHDSAYNYYGTLLATCSSDQKIAIQEKNQDSWILNDSWKAHDASVLRISFGHPEFGSILVSCGMDRTVKVWEELESEPRGNGRRWIERAKLTDSRGAVQSVQFSPNHLGLKIAACSSDVH